MYHYSTDIIGQPLLISNLKKVLSDCSLTPSEQFFGYIKERTSNIDVMTMSAL